MSEVDSTYHYEDYTCVEGEHKCANCGFLLSHFSYSQPITWWEHYLYDRWVAKTNKELRVKAAQGITSVTIAGTTYQLSGPATLTLNGTEYKL